MEDLKLRKKNLIMFPLGTIGRDMVYALVTNFLLTYILFTKGLTAAQLAAVTAIMVAARIFDGLNDPVMGNIIESTRTKWGKFKPWLVVGVLSTSVVITVLFNSNLKGWSFIVLFGISYFAFSITYTMNDISYWGMVPALSSDAEARNQFTSRATLFAGIGGTLASILIPMLTTGEMALGGSASTAYGIIAIGISILAPLFLCFTVFGVQERRDDQNTKPAKIGVKKIVGTFKGNDQLLWISVIFLLQQIGNGIIVGGVGSTYIYFDFGYSGGLYSIFTTVGMAATAFLMIFYPAISRKVNRKPLMNIMMAISIVGYVLMLGAGLFVAADTLRFWGIVIGYMLSNFGQYGFYLIMMISIINTVEYNEYKTGMRDEAIIASVRPFITKLGSALIVMLTSISYMMFGVTNYTNQISDLESAAASGAIVESEKLNAIDQIISGVGSGQITGLLVFMTVVPCAFMLASHLLYQKKYKLDEAEYDRICKELAAH